MAGFRMFCLCSSGAEAFRAIIESCPGAGNQAMPWPGFGRNKLGISGRLDNET